MRKTAIFIAALSIFSAVAFAQDLPKIAVYVTGEDVDNRNKALGRLLLTSLVDSKRYKAVDHAGTFFNEAAEHSKQRGGAVDYGWIRETGRRYGAGFVCIAKVTPLTETVNTVSARILNLETRTVVAAGETESPLKTLDDDAEAARLITAAMHADTPPQTEPEPESAHVVKQAHPEPEHASAMEQAHPEPEHIPVMEQAEPESEHAPAMEQAESEPEPTPEPVPEPPPSAPAAPDTGKPNIAVYVTGDVPDGEKKALGKFILTSLVESGRYRAVKQPGAFFNEAAEHDKSRESDTIDHGQIREIGKRHEAALVCMVNVTAATDAHTVSARVVDVESGEVVAEGETESPLKTLDDATEAARLITAAMHEDTPPQTESEPAPALIIEEAQPEPEPVLPPLPPPPAPVARPEPPPPEPAAPDTGKPNIAVYVTGAVSDEEKGALGTRILAALVNRGRYRGVERSSTFLAEIDREMVKQRSGAIDDSQISELGKQFGVKFICIADITPAYDAFQVSARIVNVETAEVAYIGEAFSPRKTALYITWVSDQVVRKMFGEKPLPEPHDPSRIRISAGAGAFIPGGLGGGVAWGNREQVAMPYTGVGAYLFFDAMYAEAFIGYSTGSGKWESVNTDPEDLPDMQRSYLHVDLFAKYPFGAGAVKFFPLMGIGYELSIAGKLQFPDDEHYVFNGKNGRLGSNALSAVWVRLGGGLDFDMGRSVYLRSEFLYGIRTANAYENDVAASTGDGWTMPGHGFTLKIGLGIKFAELNF
jgi:hypothetical protein